MAKKKTEKKAPADKTTTYSTRLNEDQRAHLEEAAATAGVSASRFIRDATLRAAADVVNASSPNDRAITSIAAKLADTLLNLKGTVTFDTEYDVEQTSNYFFGGGPVSLQDTDDEGPRRIPKSVEIHNLYPKDIRQLASIAEACPFSFAQAFIMALRGVSEPTPDFTVRSNPDQLLSD